MDTTPLADVTFTVPGDTIDEISMSMRAHLKIMDRANTPIIEQNKQNAAEINKLRLELDALTNENARLKEAARLSDMAYDDLHGGLLQMLDLPPNGDVVAAVAALLKAGTPPVVVPTEVIGELPGFATYLVDLMGDGKQRTSIMSGHIDKLQAAGIKEVVMLCNDREIEEGTLPNYMGLKKMGWWADTFYAVYKVEMSKVVRDTAMKIPPDKIPDYFGKTVERCDEYPAHRGYVLDDVHSITPPEFEAVTSAIRKHSKKPIVASFGVLSDITAYLPTINKHHVFVARQLYRHEKADQPTTPAEDTPEERTKIVTDWLTKKGMVCHVGNLEYYKEGSQTTRADDLRHMYNRCIRAGLKSFMGYAAVDSTGFKIWDVPDLWAAFKECAAAYPNEVKIAQPA